MPCRLLLALGVVLAAAGCLSAPPRAAAPGLPPTSPAFARRALLLTEYIEQTHWDDRQQAYLDRVPPRPDGLPYATMWANGVQFTVLAAAARADAPRYAPRLRRFLDGLERYWNPRRRLYSAYFGGTEDVYYDDNQWLVLGDVEAYETTRDPLYLDKARTLLDACLAGLDDVRGGGSYWHVDTATYPTKNTCSNAPLATALLRVARHTPDAEARARYQAQAAALLAWTRDTLQDTRGLMLDNLNVRTGELNRWTFTYNTALMIQGWLELHVQTGSPAHLAEAVRLGRAAAHWLQADGPRPAEHHYQENAYFVVHLVEALLALHDVTGETDFRAACAGTADHYWHTWYQGAPLNLLDLAAVARLQWVLAAREPARPPTSPAAAGQAHSVRVELTGKGRILSLAEVEVLAAGRNLAVGGSACQSSLFENGYAARAVDGIADGTYAAGHVTHTAADRDNPWWEVELAEPDPVDAVRLWNRTDSRGERLAGARVLVLDGERRVLWSRTVERAPERDLLLTPTATP